MSNFHMHFATGLVGFLLQYSVIISSLPISNDTDPDRAAARNICSQYFLSALLAAARRRLPEFVCLIVVDFVGAPQRTLISSKSVSQGCGLRARCNLPAHSDAHANLEMYHA